MAVSAVQAVVTAHLEGSVNRLRRQLGTLGVVATTVLVVAAFVVFVLPFVAGLSLVGYLLGEALRADVAYERNLSGLALFLSMLTLLGGFFSGIGGASRQLPWESLLAYPVGPRALFAAELVAGVTEFLTVVEVVALAGVCVGVTVASPRAAPFLLVAFGCGVLLTLSLQLAVASLAQRLTRQVRLLVVTLPLLAFILSLGSPALLKVLTSRETTTLGQWVLAFGRASPMGKLLYASRASYGTVAWSEVPALLAPVLLFTAVSVVGAYLLVSRERPLAPDAAAGAAKALWSFAAPWVGVARLQWETLATSLPGRMMMAMPLLTVVLIRGPLAVLTARGSWVVPAAFLYAGLSSTNMLFNQFGLDRHGVKALLLLPIDEYALLKGKQVAFAAWQLVQACFLTVLLAFAGQTDRPALLLGFALSACAFFLVSMVGQFMSIWQPHPLSKNGMRGARPPLLVVLVTLATVFGGGGGLMALASVLFSRAPGWSGPVMGLVALGLGLASAPVMRFNAGFLRTNRERLVEALAATA
ncbi:MAG: hypothetical protein INH41_25200 [Myxococcaceae bacterium]|jgi:hypothetical protein|nr:hypothetical protein [Myxococcaceae bacterium]MCA3015696.1 hypothetical protein [Myxococcaceae bacterium]